MHQGSDAAPFLSAANLRFRRGEWTFVTGDSGCGKTSLLKAINGLWPYGRGNVDFPDGVKTFYAAQDVKLPNVSLKELACLPCRRHEYSDAQVAAAALHKSGLGDFIEHLAADAREGKAWDLVLSGGQKQKLIVARILLQQPGIAVPRRGGRRARPASQDRVPSGDQGPLPAHHRDQRHA